MKNILLAAFLLIFTASYAQDITPDKNTQLWNISNGYYGTINKSTLDAGISLDSIAGTTKYLSQSFWYIQGSRAYDSARILGVNTSGVGPYYIPYSGGLKGRGTLSATVIAYKGGFVATATTTLVVTPEQSPNGYSGWTTIPGVTAATVNATSKTTAVTATFNIADLYTPYVRLKCTSTDTTSVQGFINFKPKTY